MFSPFLVFNIGVVTRTRAWVQTAILLLCVATNLVIQSPPSARADRPANVLTTAHVVINDGQLPAAERVASQILVEEVEKRSGARWSVGIQAIASRPSIYLLSKSNLPTWAQGSEGGSTRFTLPSGLLDSPVLKHPEGFVVTNDVGNGRNEVWVVGSDARGVMFGVGHLLRQLDIEDGKVSLSAAYQAASYPDRAIRGHQIGYRPRANSWDAWTVEQFDQYFRDMVVFGANCMENIPFQDNDPHPLMKISRDEMNLQFSRLCMKYDLDHWLWVPVELTLAEQVQEADQFLKRQEAFYANCPRLDAIFVPGGDPGHNPSAHLLPYLEKMAAVLVRHHPKAQIWLSLQGFKQQDIDDFYNYVDRNQPDWLGGVVMGPSSPPMESTRQRLPARYKLRWYPDITHIVRCQYPIPWLDPAWGLTIGREGVNPRPLDYAAIYERDYRFTDGFLSYSDGINDDFNKNLWSSLAWSPDRSVREITREYARYFFDSQLVDVGADAIFGLETNLRGPAEINGSVAATLALWQQMEAKLPSAKRNWRFNMHLFRAYFDAYTQARLIQENLAERYALAELAKATPRNMQESLRTALARLQNLTPTAEMSKYRQRIDVLADELYQSIGYQTSVPKFGASGYERGCMMDYVDYPLNNRWWLEDQLEIVSQLPTLESQLARMHQIAGWEQPGPGGFYDAVGHVAKSHRVVQLQRAVDALRREPDLPAPTQRNIGPQRNGLRMSFHVYLDQLPTMVYSPLNRQAKYTVKLFAQRESPLVIDGKLARKIRTGIQFDQVTEQEFEVPAEAVRDGRIELSWAALDEKHLNWRQRHYVTDIWVLPQPQER